MKEPNTVEKINSEYKNLKEHISEQNNFQIREILSQIDNLETVFLENYQKRKHEGVYYTDSEITFSIIANTFREYFQKRLNLPRDNQSYMKDLVSKNGKKDIIRLLKTTKICDPACGSGIFLLNAANFISELLQQVVEDEIKEEDLLIILKNIHGYDITQSAVYLTRMKLLWWYYEYSHTSLKSAFQIVESNILEKNSIFNEIRVEFDIIIGNPPYGNIFSKKEKKKLKDQNLFHKDIYCTFILKSLDWINKGTIGLLVPKSFLLRQGYIKMRDDLFNRANILRIYDIGSNQFSRATNEVLIIIYEKKMGQNNKDIKIFDYPTNFISEYPQQQPDNLMICKNRECDYTHRTKKFFIYTHKEECPYCSSKTENLNRIRIKSTKSIQELINIIEEKGDLNYLNVKEYPTFIRGEESKGLKQVKNILQDNLEQACYYIHAKDDLSYFVIRPRKSFNINKLKPKELKGNDYEYYTGIKLLIKHNNIIPEAYYSEENVCFTSSIYSLLHENASELKYLCGVLNSALIQFYCIYGINNQKDTTINLNQYMIRHLPIIHADKNQKEEIASSVDSIIKLFKISNGSFNNELKSKLTALDGLIFRLYEISDKQIELIISHLTHEILYFQKIYEDI